MEGPYIRDIGMALVQRGGPRAGADDLTRQPISAVQQIEQRGQHDHVAEPAEVEDRGLEGRPHRLWGHRVREPQALDTASREI